MQNGLCALLLRCCCSLHLGPHKALACRLQQLLAACILAWVLHFLADCSSCSASLPSAEGARRRLQLTSF